MSLPLAPCAHGALPRVGSGDKRLGKLRKHVRRVIRDNVPVRPWRGARLIGAGGTFTNLAGIVLSRQGWTALARFRRDRLTQ